MRDAFRWVIRTYGREVICLDENGGERARCRAIIRPMTEADWQKSAMGLGSYRKDRFLCLALPELPLDCAEVGRQMMADGERFEVIAAHPICVGGARTHLWIALRPGEEQV